MKHFMTKEQIARQREHDETERQWTALADASTDDLIDVLTDRPLDNDQWVTLMRFIGGRI